MFIVAKESIDPSKQLFPPYGGYYSYMERITLRIFWIAMLSCAVLAIGLFWAEDSAPEYLFKIMGTLFVIGLANFLIWAPTVAYRFLKK